MRSAFPGQPAESSPVQPLQRGAADRGRPAVEVVARLAVQRDRIADISANLAERLLALAARTASPDVEIRVDFRSTRGTSGPGGAAVAGVAART